MLSKDNQNFIKKSDMPHCLDSEKALLGGLLLKGEELHEVQALVRHKDFYSPLHSKIFEAMTSLELNKKPIDIVTLNNELKNQNSDYNLEQVTGLLDAPTTVQHLVHYAKIIREKAALRSLISVSQTNIDIAIKENFSSLDTFLDEAEKRVFEATQKKEQAPFLDTKVLSDQALEDMHNLSLNKGQLTGVSSGFQELDEMLYGFQKGEFYIVAARPSMGKTAFSLNLALNAAIESKKTVAFFSIEMSSKLIVNRLLATLGQIDQHNLRSGLKEKDMDNFIQAINVFSKAPIFIDDSDVSPFDIRAKCRKLKAAKGLDLIIVDYLQLLRLHEKAETRQVEVGEISRLLKLTSKELDVPVIALAQLNRSVEARTNRRPMLSDLRESGSIEQDADAIMMLYREDYYENADPEQSNIAEVIITKHRNGPTGTVQLKWVPEYGQFKNNIPETAVEMDSLNTLDASQNPFQGIPNIIDDFNI